jgi:hypothetical protein
MSTESKKHHEPTNESRRDPFPEPRTMPGKWDTSGMESQKRRGNQRRKNNPEGEENSSSDSADKRSWEASELTSWYNR